MFEIILGVKIVPAAADHWLARSTCDHGLVWL